MIDYRNTHTNIKVEEDLNPWSFGYNLHFISEEKKSFFFKAW